jgi:two-component system, LytTR family, sensor histidine kinase AlgZ
MNPILESRGALAVYLACWLPNALLIAALFFFAGHFTWIAAIAMALPMTVIYAFLCLSSWYLCIFFPLQKGNLLRLFAVFVPAALVSSMIWILAGKVLIDMLGSAPPLLLQRESYSRMAPFLAAAGILLFLLNVAVNYLMIFFNKNIDMERRALQLRLLAQQAEMKALKAQIDPHFLFNSLNSISALITIDAAGSRKMCLMLSDFLRKSLRLGAKKFITLEEELELSSMYLDIEKIRLGSRLVVTMHIKEECKKCIVPPLLLQPLVENALTHGIRHLLDGGEIRIAAEKYGSHLQIAVENSQDPEKPSQKGEGIGLANVRGRLMALFESEARLECMETPNTYQAVLIMPARTLSKMHSAEFI